MNLFGWTGSWKFWRVVLWCVHIVLLLLILVGLWALARRYNLGQALTSPWPDVHPIWLPLLVLLLYLGAWLAFGFIRLLTEPSDAEFPDVKDAWAEALSALDAADIDLARVPIFLVVGQPEGGVADYFNATEEAFAIRGKPDRADSPLRVYATREAVFVAVPGASALGTLCAELAKRERPQSTPELNASLLPLPNTTPNANSLLDSPELVPLVLAETAPAPAPEPKVKASVVTEWLRKPGHVAVKTLTADEIRRASARLRFLCRLIATKRRPMCPGNGVLWLLPTSSTATLEEAEQTAMVCKADLAAIESGWQVDCPMTAVFADAEQLPGLRELIRSVPKSALRERLLGRGFALVPNIVPEQRYGMVQDGCQWVVSQLAPALVYQQLGEGWEPESSARLWRLLSEVHERRDAIARLIAGGLLARTARPPMLSGVYFAATGLDVQDRAFCSGAMRELIAHQNYVSWTPVALARELDTRRMAGFGYFGIVMLVMVVLAFALMSFS